MGGGTAFFYEWGSGLFSFTVPIIKCKSAKEWHCKIFMHEFCDFFVNVKLDSSSLWTLTGNTYITSLEGDVSQINTNGYKLYVGGKLVK